MTVKAITDYLNAHDIKPSYQRIKVYEVLVGNTEHPTAEMIYRELIKTIPTLSKTTIYNSLKTFIDKGIVKIVAVDGNEMHYDPVLEEHGHFRCNRCGKLYNVELDAYKDYDHQLKGFIVEEHHILLKGICSDCNR